MGDQELVDVITNLVMQQLQKNHKDSKQILIVGEKDCHYAQIAISRFKSKSYHPVFYQDEDYNGRLGSYDYIVVPYLNVDNIVNLSIGTWTNTFEKAIISCIMENQKVFVLNNQADEIAQQCNPNFFDMLLGYMKKLESFQVIQCSLNDLFNSNHQKQESIKNLSGKKLITEKDILDVDTGGAIKISNSLITPLAQDMIRTKKIKTIVE